MFCCMNNFEKFELAALRPAPGGAMIYGTQRPRNISCRNMIEHIIQANSILNFFGTKQIRKQWAVQVKNHMRGGCAQKLLFAMFTIE